jgi:hypothetical protein
MLHQTVVHTRTVTRDARAIHRTIEHDHHGTRTLWAQPTPNTLILRTREHVTWSGWNTARSITQTLTPDLHPAGTRLAWSLIANPTHSIHLGVAADGQPAGRGRRTGIAEPGHAVDWLRARLASALALDTPLTAHRISPVHGAKGLLLTRWVFSGTGTVHHPEDLAALLTGGVGRGKAFGCGLLLVQPEGPRP